MEPDRRGRREAGRAGLAVAAVVLATFLVAPVADACSCTPPKAPRVEMESATAVFSGRVLEVEPIGDRGFRQSGVRFALDGVWKGVPEGEEVRVITAGSGATCGYSFEVGEEYLVYAHGDRESLTTGLCTRTDRLERAEEDLAALGPPQREPARAGPKCSRSGAAGDGGRRR